MRFCSVAVFAAQAPASAEVLGTCNAVCSKNGQMYSGLVCQTYCSALAGALSNVVSALKSQKACVHKAKGPLMEQQGAQSSQRHKKVHGCT